MPLLKPIFNPSLLAAAMIAGSLSLPALAQDQEQYPEAVQQLIDRGVTVTDSFAAPADMTGYVGEMQGQPIAFYLTPDKENVVVGTLLSANGENLTEPKIQELVQGPKNQKAWSTVEDADWIRDGDADAPVVVYTFTDPNCPFCHRFRKAAQPWVDAGKVQLRHVMVGILKQDSLPKAATIVGADNASDALHENQQGYDDGGGISVNREIVSENAKRIRENNQLMSSLGLSATPSTYYRDEDGNVQMKQGAPRPGEMEAIMGSPRP